MKIIPLSEGSFTIDRTKEFIPFDKSKDDLQKRTIGSLLVEIQPFVVLNDKDIIVIDCGLGFSNHDGVLQIHQNLINNNIDPMEVTKVLLSHLHKDHAGGAVKFDELLNRWFLSFPNATYYVNRQELELARKPGNPSYIPSFSETLYNSSNVVLLDENGTIDGYIKYEMTAAHSPFHLVYWIEEKNETIFFGGDDAPQHQQMKSRFVAKYDFNGKKAMELRTSWWEKGTAENWFFLFYHDIKTPFIQP